MGDQWGLTTGQFFQLQSTLILILLYVGVYFRRNRSRHVKLMSCGIIWDILLVLQIEITRHAIEKASQFQSNSPLLNFHVSIAVATVLLYFCLIYFGRKLLKGENQWRKIHRHLGLITMILRTTVYVTSWIIEKQ
jgi:hypothetical protein